jgi:hypothetical protein
VDHYSLIGESKNLNLLNFFRIFSNREKNSSGENSGSIMDLFSCFRGIENDENNLTLKFKRK